MSAAQALRKTLRMQTGAVVCTIVESTSVANRGICNLGEEDLALTLVRGGSVTVDTRIAAPSYLAAERKAREAGLGLWGSDFVEPATWRQGQAACTRGYGRKIHRPLGRLPVEGHGCAYSSGRQEPRRGVV